MKNFIFKNFGYKILAIIFAILLWLVVINITDYTITVKIEDIPVEQLNTDVLDELDQVYDVVKGDTVDIYIKGRRSVVGNLSSKNFYAYADVSQMSITNSVQIYVTPRNKNIEDEISIEYVDNIMQLSLEDKVSEQFPVKVVTKGDPDSDYAVGEAYAMPNIVTIEGPKSAVDKITDVVVSININGAKDNISTVGDIEILDAYGEQIKNDKVTISQSSADINVNIYPIKTVGVFVNVKGTPADGYGISEVVYQPQTVDIAGEEEVLESIESIEVNDISVSGLNESLQTTVNLADYIPENAIVAQANSEIAITVDIEKLTSKTVNLTSSDISFTGKDSGYEYDIETTDNIIVEISGLENIISELEVKDIKPTVDCSELNTGSHTVEIKFEDIEGVKYSVTGVITVTVHIKDSETD